MRRSLELDAIRGLMLVWMTLMHLPTVLSTVINEPFGFVSSAEGFIFLSALLTGLIYFRVAGRDGYGMLCRRLSFRSLRLYIDHALLLAFTFLLVAPIAAQGNRPGLHNLLDFYFAAGRARAFLDGLLMIYRPPLLDILPMYVLFLLLTPVLFLAARRIGWESVLGGSFTVWLMAQFGIRQAAYHFMTHAFGLRIPLNEMGAFDLWAWQFLWVLGVWCGVRWAKDELPVKSWSRRLAVPAALAALAALGLRYGAGIGLQLGHFGAFFDKWHLGAFRLIDFAAVAALLIRFPALVKPLVTWPLVKLGQASLPVFCAHLFFCFLGLTIVGEGSTASGWEQVVLLVVTFAALLLVANLFRKDKQKPDSSLPSRQTEVRSLPGGLAALGRAEYVRTRFGQNLDGIQQRR